MSRPCFKPLQYMAMTKSLSAALRLGLNFEIPSISPTTHKGFGTFIQNTGDTLDRKEHCGVLEADLQA